MDSELDRTYNPFDQPCPEFEAWLDEVMAQEPDPEETDENSND